MTWRRFCSRWMPILAVAGALAIFVTSHFEPIPAGADSGGYLNSARLLTEGRWKGELRSIPEWPLAEAGPFMYVPLGFIDVQRTGQLTPSYPVGLPLHYAIAGRILGWHWGTLAIGVLAAVAAVWCTYGCLREFQVQPWLAAMSVAALAFSPMFLFTAIVPLSDAVATAWCTAAVYAALRARSARRDALAAALCGFAASVAVLVRPTNILIAPVLLLILPHWRAWLAAGIGAAPGMLFDVWYNRTLYGSAFATGYGSVDNLFQAKFLGAALHNYVTTLPLVLSIGFLALATVPLWPWAKRPRETLALALWFPIFATFYATYYYTGEYWWYLRFLLPGFPAVVVLAGIGLDALQTKLSTPAAYPARRATILVGVLLALSLAIGVTTLRQKHVAGFAAEQRPHRIIPLWAEAHLPHDAAIFCFHLSSAFYFYTHFPVLRSDQFKEEEFAAFVAAVRRTHRPVYAAIFRFDREETFQKHLRGPWKKIADVAYAEIWQLDTSP